MSENPTDQELLAIEKVDYCINSLMGGIKIRTDPYQKKEFQEYLTEAYSAFNKYTKKYNHRKTNIERLRSRLALICAEGVWDSTDINLIKEIYSKKSDSEADLRISAEIFIKELENSFNVFN